MAIGGITAAYSGVHAIYQIALAAYETGRLDCLHCSLIDAPRKWGGVLSRRLGADALINRRCPELPARSVKEFPWPVLLHAARARWSPGAKIDWCATNDWFDRHVASFLKGSASRVFVGAETCAERSFRAAKARGMKTVLDCEQVHPAFLWSLLARASEDLALPAPAPIDSPQMARRKAAEYDLADTIMVLSEVERRSFLEQGFAAGKLVEIPLWADSTIWYPPKIARPVAQGPLRVLFIGSVELRKGIPYLLQSARQCGRKIELTLVGTRHELMEPFLEKYVDSFRYVTPRTKPQLREMCWQSDLLILPSLVDAFGFVAMEAMACGLPVIVSENCGVPVPDPSWRIPIMNVDAITERLLLYADQPERCRADGQTAAKFAREYRPETYRRRVGELFAELLDAR